jgi:hypothetical protein
MTATTKVSVPGKGSLAWMADPEKSDFIVENVRTSERGYEVAFDGCRVIWLDKTYGIVPEEGDELTVIGKMFGGVRGLVFNEKLAFYRTPAEQVEHDANLTYGADAAEWLGRWDDSIGVWTIKVGGLSAGYDQCINIMVAEVVRALIEINPDKTDEALKTVKPVLEEAIAGTERLLGMSGAQYGAALSLGFQIWLHGPRKVMEMYPGDRHTQASKGYPHLETLTLRDRIAKQIEELEGLETTLLHVTMLREFRALIA